MPRVKADQLLRAMARCLAGEGLEGAREALAPFARSAAPPAFEAGETHALRRFARENADGLLRLLDSEDPAERHAAATLLGHSGDERAVDPLFTLLATPPAWVDPDYALDALGMLGDLALPGLLARALVGSDVEAALAVRAMGNSRGDALPCLERVRAERRPLPVGLYLAYESLADPLGLPDVMRAVESPETRDEALGAAQELLVRDAAERFARADREKWAEIFAPLASSEDVNVRALALVCLGRLGDLSRFEQILAGLDDPEDDVVAAAASALVHLDRAHGVRALARAVSRGSAARRALVAATLLDLRLARGPLRERAIDTLVSACTSLPDSWAHERAFLCLEKHRAVLDGLIEAMPSLPPRRMKRAADMLVELAQLRKRPATALARFARPLRGSARRARERAWERASAEEARVERELAALRAQPTSSWPPDRSRRTPAEHPPSERPRQRGAPKERAQPKRARGERKKQPPRERGEPGGGQGS
jgi:HEAT repeat protein